MTRNVAVAFISGLVLTEAARRASLRWGMLDIENARSSHAGTVPRGGGLGLVLGVTVALALATLLNADWPSARAWELHGLASLVAVIGLVDDKWGVRFTSKLAVQVVAGLLLILSFGSVSSVVTPGMGGPIDVDLTKWLAVMLTLVGVVGFANIFNFMDGIDGLAATQAVVGAIVLTHLLAASAGPLAQLAAAVGGATAGFLVHNRPPARIFMGDVGSQYLGFMLAALLVSCERDAGIPATGVGLTFLPFVVDTAWTLLVRIARGERWYEAHRQHLYQQLVGAGWSHGQTTMLYAVLSSACAVGVVLYFGRHAIAGWVVWTLAAPSLALPWLVRRRLPVRSRDILPHEPR